MRASKLQVVEGNQEPVDLSLNKLDKLSIEGIIGRPPQQTAKRVIYDFPVELAANEPPKTLWKRMVELANRKK